MTETGTLTLTDFLLARIAEDEEHVLNMSCHCDDRENAWLPDCPARVLAECEAKRRIVETFVDMDALPAGERVEQRETLRWVCQGFGSVYADHPDYREEWAL